jgi:hypothetical protein
MSSLSADEVAKTARQTGLPPGLLRQLNPLVIPLLPQLDQRAIKLIRKVCPLQRERRKAEAGGRWGAAARYTKALTRCFKRSELVAATDHQRLDEGQRCYLKKLRSQHAAHRLRVWKALPCRMPARTRQHHRSHRSTVVRQCRPAGRKKRHRGSGDDPAADIGCANTTDRMGACRDGMP